MLYHDDLLPDQTYHIFNRAVGNEKLFRSNDNYQFFLKKFKTYIIPVAEIFAWSLLPNHFHFLIRIRDLNTIDEHYKSIKRGEHLKKEEVSVFLMQCFSNFLNSYAKAYNKVYNRKGALFIDYLRRVPIEDDDQFGATVFYVHKNAIHHGYCTQMEHWLWSSYLSYKSKLPQTSASKEVLNWFGGRDEFLKYHEQPVHLKHAIVVE